MVRAYYERGCAHEMLSDVSSAVADWRVAIAKDPDHVAAHAKLAGTFVALGEPALALPLFDRAVALLSDDAELWRGRAACLRLLGREAEAAEDDDRADDADEHKLCVICMEDSREGRLRPCNHAALCQICATELLRRRWVIVTVPERDARRETRDT